MHDAQTAGLNLGIPYIELQNSNYTTNNRIHFGATAAPTSPGIFAENQYEIRDTVTKTYGAHTLRMGFEARLEQDNNNLVGTTRPTYTFAGIWNFFNDAPIYEGIQANPATGGAPVVNRYFDDHYYAAFVQHDWKITPAFTLNTGLRWEYFEPLTNNGLNVNLPVLGTTPGLELVNASLAPHNHFYTPHNKNFSPKLGFAYAPESMKGRSVLRGGFALAYNRLDDVLFDPALEDGPGVFSYGVCCGTAPQDFGSPFDKNQIVYQLGTSTAYNSYGVNPALKTPIGANGLPTSGIAIEAYGAANRLPQPYSYLYSLEVQHDLGKEFVMTVGFQGSTGRHYSRLVNQQFVLNQSGTVNGNTVSTGFGNGLYIAQDDSNQYYNALNVHASKHYHNGLSLDGTYSYAKSEDQVSSGDGADGMANQTNPGNNASELGPSDYDVRHRVVALATYDINYYHGGSYALRSVLNGWQANGIFTAHTGFPFTPVTTLIQGIPLTPTSGTIGDVRPTFYQGNYKATCSNDAFRNGTTISGVFGVQPVTGGAEPGIGRNSFRGPCYQDIDLGIAKEVKIPLFGERGVFRFQAQAFNLINKLNFSPFTFASASTLLDSSVVTANNSLGTPAGTALGTVVNNNAGTATGFGRPQSASAGRVLEFNARVNF